MTSVADADGVLAKLLDEHSMVTFRYLAQHMGMPVTDAKDALEAYAKAHHGEVHAVYLVSAASESGLSYKLVAEEHLEEASKGQFSAIHPYSLHAKPATGSGEALFILNHTQDRKLYNALSKDGSNCLLDNRWSAVKCPQATLRPNKRPRASASPSAAAPPAPAAASKPSAASAASAAAAAAAFASSSSSSKAQASKTAAKTAAKPAPAPAKEPAAEAPAAAQEAPPAAAAAAGSKKKPAAAPPAAAPPAKKGGFANLFANAKPNEAKKAPARRPLRRRRRRRRRPPRRRPTTARRTPRWMCRSGNG